MERNDPGQRRYPPKIADNMEQVSPRLRFWTQDSSFVLGFFFLIVFLITYFWWPLAEAVLRRMIWDDRWWLHMDWLLIGIFLFMSISIVFRANLKTDLFLIFIGICGGFVIESWGTQTSLWVYYTAERPPLWIIPAWSISNLSITRMSWVLDYFSAKMRKKKAKEQIPKILYWFLFTFFMILMVLFVMPTLDKSYTILALLLCVGIILTPTNYQYAVLIFLAGMGLGYFLELWGTTHKCWIYYTHQTPPLFAVLAHGMAAVAFWRTGLMLKWIVTKMQTYVIHNIKILRRRKQDNLDIENV